MAYLNKFVNIWKSKKKLNPYNARKLVFKAFLKTTNLSFTRLILIRELKLQPNVKTENLKMKPYPLTTEN